MKLRKLVITAAACIFVIGAAFGTYALSAEKYLQEISAASYDSSALAQYAEEVAALVNSERAAYGLAPVKIAPKLSEAANIRAREIQQSFSHTRPNGTSCFTAISEIGITYTAAAENIAYGQKSPESVMKAWMNSSGHRANILNSSMEYIGVGVAYSNGVYYWTQFFAASNSLSSGSYLPGGNYETEIPAETSAPETQPEPEITTAPETNSEPEAAVPSETKPEPEVTASPEAKPEPESTAPSETKPEPEVTAAPETKPEPEVTTAPETSSQPQQTESKPEVPCVTDCDSSEDCFEGNGSISCTPCTPCEPDIPCVTDCDSSGNCSPNVSGSADCNTSGNCPTAGNQNSGNCSPDVSGSNDCNTSGNCPTTGNQNSSDYNSGCPSGIQDIFSSITGSSGSCPNNNSSSGNCFGDILSWIGGSCNSSSGNSYGSNSGNCNTNSGSGNCNSSNSNNSGNSIIFGTQSSSGCPLTNILGSMFG